jgi:hypothetical protein
MREGDLFELVSNSSFTGDFFERKHQFLQTLGKIEKRIDCNKFEIYKTDICYYVKIYLIENTLIRVYDSKEEFIEDFGRFICSLLE